MARAAGLQLELPLLADMARPLVPQSVELSVRWGALLQRHHRPLLITATIIAITATTATDTTRVTTDGDITVLTADKLCRAPRPPRQMPLRGTERQGSLQWPRLSRTPALHRV